MLPVDLDIAMLRKNVAMFSAIQMKKPIRKKERTSGILYVTPRNENSTNVRKKTMNRSKVKNHLKSYRK